MKPAPYTVPEQTIELLRKQFGWMWACCGIDCSHYAALPLGCIAARIGADSPASALRKRLQCTRCGRRSAVLSAPSVVDHGLAPLPLNRVPEGFWRQMAREALLSIGAGASLQLFVADNIGAVQVAQLLSSAGEARMCGDSRRNNEWLKMASLWEEIAHEFRKVLKLEGMLKQQ